MVAHPPSPGLSQTTPPIIHKMDRMKSATERINKGWTCVCVGWGWVDVAYVRMHVEACDMYKHACNNTCYMLCRQNNTCTHTSALFSFPLRRTESMIDAEPMILQWERYQTVPYKLMHGLSVLPYGRYDDPDDGNRLSLGANNEK